MPADRTIWKYRLDMGTTLIPMPAGAIPRAAMMQDGTPALWAEVDPAAPPETRGFLLVGTGHPIPEIGMPLRYISTMPDGPFVWHVYEIVKEGSALMPADIQVCRPCGHLLETHLTPCTAFRHVVEDETGRGESFGTGRCGCTAPVVQSLRLLHLEAVLEAARGAVQAMAQMSEAVGVIGQDVPLDFELARHTLSLTVEEAEGSPDAR